MGDKLSSVIMEYPLYLYFSPIVVVVVVVTFVDVGIIIKAMSTALSPKIIKVRRDNKQQTSKGRRQIELRHLIKKYRKFDKNRTIVNNYLPELLISV